MLTMRLHDAVLGAENRLAHELGGGPLGHVGKSQLRSRSARPARGLCQQGCLAPAR
jgi:hypothetical protein